LKGYYDARQTSRLLWQRVDDRKTLIIAVGKTGIGHQGCGVGY